MTVQQDTNTEERRHPPAVAATAETGHASAPAVTGRIRDYIISRFNKENLLGSVLDLSGAYRSYQRMQAALVRQVNGEKQPDKVRAVNSAIFAATNAWSFLSTRGGKFPEGKNALARIGNALKHPNESSSQFGYLLTLPANMMSIYNNTDKGLKAHGIGLKPGEKPYAPEKVRLYTSVLTFLSVLCNGYGHFKQHRTLPPKPDDTAVPAKPPAKKGLIGILQKIWNYDRMLMVAAALDITVSTMGIVEGWAKTKKSSEEAMHLLQSGVISLLTTVGSNIYVFQRIVKSNYTEQPPEQMDRSDATKHAPLAKQSEPRRKHTERLSMEPPTTAALTR